MKRRKTRRKTRRTSAKTKSKRTLGDIAAVWKALILFNMLLSVFGFWMIYSQNNYMLDVIESNLPVAIVGDYKGTSIVVNPLTGQFIMVNSITVAGVFLAILSLVGMYFLLQENL